MARKSRIVEMPNAEVMALDHEALSPNEAEEVAARLKPPAALSPVGGGGKCRLADKKRAEEAARYAQQATQILASVGITLDDPRAQPIRGLGPSAAAVAASQALVASLAAAQQSAQPEIASGSAGTPSPLAKDAPLPRSPRSTGAASRAAEGLSPAAGDLFACQDISPLL
jgi:hypothetical protein